MRLFNKKIVAGFLTGIIVLSSFLAVKPAEAELAALGCSELDAIVAALSTADFQDPEFKPLIQLVTRTKIEYQTKSLAKQADVANKINSAVANLTGFVDFSNPESVPVAVKSNASSTEKQYTRDTFLATAILQAGQNTQNAAGDPECTAAINKILDAMDKIVAKVIDASNKASKLDTILNFLETLGGSLLGFGGTPDIGRTVTTVSDIVNAKKQLFAVNLALKIYNKEAEIMEKAGVSSIVNAEALSSRKAKLQLKIQELEARQQKLKELAGATFKDYLKAAGFALGRQVILSGVNNFISKALDLVGAKRPLEQAQALAKNYFAIEYIRQHYEGDVEQALITKYLMDAAYAYEPAKVQAAHTAIEQQAIRYGGEACSSPNIKDPNFAYNMAKCGSMNANPLFLKTEAYQQAQSAIAVAETAARNEILKDGGANSVLGYYDGALEEQATFDAETSQLLAQVKLAQKILDEAKKNGSRDAILAAEEALKGADKNYKAKLTTVDGPAKKLFQGIVMPGPVLSKFITDKGLSAMINTDKLDPEQLPSSILNVTKLFGDILGKWMTGSKSSQSGISLKDAVFSNIGPGLKTITDIINSSSGSGNSSPTGSSGPIVPTDSCPVPGTCGGPGNTALKAPAGSVAGAQTSLQMRGPAAGSFR